MWFFGVILGEMIFDGGMVHTIVFTILAGVRFHANMGAKVDFEVRFRRADLSAFATVPFALFQVHDLNVMSQIGIVREGLATVVA